MGFSQGLGRHHILQFIGIIVGYTLNSCIIMKNIPTKQLVIMKSYNKSVNRGVPRISLRLAEKESWSTIQICAEGKGLLRPWGWNGCRNAEAGKRLILSDWPPPFLTHCGRGKPQGCLEPAEAVLKGKPHAFESWSGYLLFWYSHFSPCCQLCSITSCSRTFALSRNLIIWSDNE